MRLLAIGRYVRTVRHLHVAQVAHRIRLRGQRAILARSPSLMMRQHAQRSGTYVPGWPAGYLPADARASSAWPAVDELQKGSITLLGQTRQLDDAMWRSSAETQLWRFHLHYWDWAWSLASASDEAARLTFERWYESWTTASQFGRMDEWAPYVASLRAWSWCGQFGPLVSGTRLERALLHQLWLHRDFLVWHLEKDVEGNHLIKNLKALVGLAVFLGDGRLLKHAVGGLREQLQHQVLPDGGHYERSPSYHCQVMADVQDVYELLVAARRSESSVFRPVVERMGAWLDAVVDSTGRLPALNDGFPVPPGLLNLLLPARRSPASVVDLSDTGLTIIERGPWRLLLDNGAPCPDELPAHAHADTLAVELQVEKEPLVVDTGTSTYTPGPVRDYERSTAAHSTLTVDNENSTETWGAFRAGRRARVLQRTIAERAGGIELRARHDGYRWIGGKPEHERRVIVTSDEVSLIDVVEGAGQHDLKVRLHLSVGARVERIDNCCIVVSLPQGASVTVASNMAIAIEETQRAIGYGRRLPAPTLVMGGTSALPVEIRTHLSLQATSSPRSHSAGAASSST